jgi:homoserine kinase
MSTAIESDSRPILVSVPATTANLGPGFDCLGLALDLRNEVSFTSSGPMVQYGAGDTNYRIKVEGLDAAKVPADHRNLVAASAEEIFRLVGRRPSSLDVQLFNQIPVASGLGSSSTAIVAGLAGANALVDGGLSCNELLRMAVRMEGHPDNVAPAMLGGLVLGILPDLPPGPDELVVCRLAPPHLTAVVVLPDYLFLTANARAALPPSLPMADAVFNASRLGLLLHTLTTGDFTHLRIAMSDRLHQSHRMKLIPGATAAYEAAYEAGALGVALSGAGPSLLAFAIDEQAAIAGAMSAAFAEAGLTSRSWILDPSSEGMRLSHSSS